MHDGNVTVHRHRRQDSGGKVNLETEDWMSKWGPSLANDLVEVLMEGQSEIVSHRMICQTLLGHIEGSLALRSFRKYSPPVLYKAHGYSPPVLYKAHGYSPIVLYKAHGYSPPVLYKAHGYSPPVLYKAHGYSPPVLYKAHGYSPPVLYKAHGLCQNQRTPRQTPQSRKMTSSIGLEYRRGSMQFRLNEPDVNQNKDHPSKSTGTAASAALHSKDRANPEDPGASGPRPHLARLFSRDAPGREDNTFKDRPSESDELHTIPEELPGTGAHSASENAEQDAD
ncbi:hypothetical protein P4O66_002256 [Electrophorus voltai]|uniref:Myelin basic protein n=1 Tax=Electrophorus voltai TaxID=2609070 RepID=A0AAD8YYZ7_9TELE|nr:hypothetical protein P4O66_002256 [Electrophorus voltai]